MKQNNKRGNSGVESWGIVKRVVLVSAILAITGGITKARGYWRSYRTRYSPYAFSHKHPSGLIDGELNYSPYAFSHKNTPGLVPYWYRYSPYAFSPKHPTGLISDYGSGYWYPPYATVIKFPNFSSTLVERIEKKDQGPSYEQRLAARRELTKQMLKEAEERRQQEGLDEPALFRSWCETLDEPYNMAIGKIRNRTSWVHVTFPRHNLIIAWQDPNWKHTSYDTKLNQLREKEMTIHQITETDQIQLTSKLERIAVQYLR